jgi:hypothetical protein
MASHFESFKETPQPDSHAYVESSGLIKADLPTHGVTVAVP